MPTISFRKIISDTFNTVDAANLWEILHCRFTVQNGVLTVGRLPQYGDLRNLYQRSLTHSLPLLGTLANIDIELDGHAAKTVLEAFEKYLIIRQLSDDLHDWKADTRVGHISYVVMRILEDAGVSPGPLPLKQLVPTMERVFLHHTLPAIGHEIMGQAAQAHALLATSDIIDAPNVIDRLIGDIEHTTEHMLIEHARAASFVKAYRAAVY